MTITRDQVKTEFWDPLTEDVDLYRGNEVPIRGLSRAVRYIWGFLSDEFKHGVHAREALRDRISTAQDLIAKLTKGLEAERTFAKLLQSRITGLEEKVKRLEADAPWAPWT